MGSLKAEMRRFEQRRLRPILRRLKQRQSQLFARTVTNDSMEQLLAAFLRSEIRRAESKPNVWANLSAALHSRLSRHQADGPHELEHLVRTMLATPIPPAANGTHQEAA